ncbi:MAG TPA: EAL domain-containing protein [Sphingomonadales bacterium]
MTQSTPRLPQQIVAWRSPRDPAGAERGKTADWPRLRERVAALYRQIPIQVLAGLLSLVILLVQLSGRMATMPLLGWAGLVLLCLAFRWGVGRVERRAALKLGMREWERLWFMAALPGAVALAAAIGHSLAQVPAENRLMLLGSVIPAAAGGLVLSTASFRAAALTLVPLFLLPALSLILMEGLPSDLASLCAVMLALLLCVAWQLERQALTIAETSRQCAALEAHLATQSYLTNRSRDVLNGVLECIKAGIAVFDRNLCLVAWNDEYASLFPDDAEVLQEGRPVEAVLRAFYRSFGHSKQQEDRVIEACTARLRPDAPDDVLRAEHVLPDGRTIEVTGQRTLEDGWVFTVSDLTVQRKATAEALIHISRHDSLTGLPNRATIRRSLERAVAAAGRNSNLVTVITINIGGFRTINDGLGTLAGDAVLVEVARILRRQCSERDILGRLGGDEFAVISTADRNAAEAEARAHRIVRALREPIEANGKAVTVGAAAGVTVYPVDQSNPDELLRNSGAALARARAAENQPVVMFDRHMQQEMQARAALEADLRATIDSHHFMFQYQPQVDLKTRQLVGVEALLRWHHPERGWVTPDKFIHVAELSRLIIPLTETMIPEICMQARAWDARGLPPFKIAVNLSPVHIRKGGFETFLEKTLAAHGISPDRLEFEITESVTMTDSAEAVETLRRLEALGVSLAIDDFGTGYSSISYLRRFPVNKLKIDRSFVSEVTTDRGARAIVEAVIRLGHSFGQLVVAEGAETEEQVAALQAIGCDVVQGYFFSKPLHPDELARWVEERYLANPAPLQFVPAEPRTKKTYNFNA